MGGLDQLAHRRLEIGPATHRILEAGVAIESPRQPPHAGPLVRVEQVHLAQGAAENPAFAHARAKQAKGGAKRLTCVSVVFKTKRTSCAMPLAYKHRHTQPAFP